MWYLENWFYDSYMILNSHKYEFVSFKKSERIKKEVKGEEIRKNSMEIRYLPIIRSNLKNCHWGTAWN